MLLMRLFSPLFFIMFPTILFTLDLISYSFLGLGCFLNSYFLVELNQEVKNFNIFYITFFLLAFYSFTQNFILNITIFSTVSILGLKLKNILNLETSYTYLLAIFNLFLNIILNLIFRGLKIGLLYTIWIFFANIIIIYLSLKFLAHYKPGNRF